MPRELAHKSFVGHEARRGDDRKQRRLRYSREKIVSTMPNRNDRQECKRSTTVAARAALGSRSSPAELRPAQAHRLHEHPVVRIHEWT